jgi:hypothetical protein
MNYDKLISTISEILSNENIYTTGLTLTYELPEKQHKQLNEDLFFRLNPKAQDFVLTDTFEVEISGILVKFVKK